MEPEAYHALRLLQDQHWWFRGRRQVLTSLIDSFLPTDGETTEILEAGCGYGGNLAMLAQFGSVRGFELDDQARCFARETSGLPVAYGVLPDQPGFADERFDLVAMLDVLEHIDDDVGSLQRLRCMLKPGGHILITVPALPWLWSKHDEIHHHKRRYSRKSLMLALHAAQLRPARIGYFNSLLLPLAIAQRFGDRVMAREARVDDLPPKTLNAMFARIFGWESKLLGRLPMPLGLSLYAVAERADA